MSRQRQVGTGAFIVSRRTLLGGMAATAAFPRLGYGDDAPAANLNLFVPAPAGGGLDRVAQALAKAAKGLTGAPQTRFEYAPGESGMTGLARFLSRRGQNGQVLVASLSIMGAGLATRPALRLSEATPLVRLENESLLLVVPAHSPFRSFDDLMNALAEGPRPIAITGGAVGGADHLLAAALIAARQLEARRMVFTPASSLGLSRVAMLEDRASCAIGAWRDFEVAYAAGQIRILAASDARSLPVQAIDLRDVTNPVSFEAWRGLFAPPGIALEQQQAMVAVLERILASADWRQQAEHNHWAPGRSAGLPFSAYIASEEDRVMRQLKAVGAG